MKTEWLQKFQYLFDFETKEAVLFDQWLVKNPAPAADTPEWDVWAASAACYMQESRRSVESKYVLHILIKECYSRGYSLWKKTRPIELEVVHE